MTLTRREWLAASLAPAAAPAVQTSRSRRPPNVLIFITDDQGYGDVSLHGNPVLQTPNLDRIGREGMQFTQFQVCPVCSPTRSSLMTGRYNYRTGVVDTYLGRSMMHPDEVTMAEYLGKAGYRTGIFGKWHLGDNYPLRSIDQGFQESIVCKGGGVGQPSDPPGNSYFDPILQNMGKEQKYPGYCTDIFFQQGMEFLERNRRHPWFLYLPTNAPHDPLTIADKYVDPFRGKGLDDATAKTYGMVANIDENAGKLLAKLRELKLEENTILIYLTDNGPQRNRFNGGMRGIKGTPYQGGIRVPFFLRWPGRVRPGTKADRAAAHIDVLPTILEACGVKADGPKMDGRSLMPLLKGDGAHWADRTLFTQWHRGDVPELFRDCAARTQQYKLVRGHELFDLTADPGERNEISRQKPDVAARLRRETEAWFQDVSSTRGYAPPRIHLGTPHESPTILTRQDWRGENSGWATDSVGHWEVDVRTAAKYYVKVRMAKMTGDANAELRVGTVTANAPVPAGAGSCRFELALPAGPARLEVMLESGSERSGPQYVDVSKM
ncbi:MAG: arylsulfatase [Bryobacteraceae bacterium]